MINKSEHGVINVSGKYYTYKVLLKGNEMLNIFKLTNKDILTCYLVEHLIGGFNTTHYKLTILDDDLAKDLTTLIIYEKNN